MTSSCVEIIKKLAEKINGDNQSIINFNEYLVKLLAEIDLDLKSVRSLESEINGSKSDIISRVIPDKRSWVSASMTKFSEALSTYRVLVGIKEYKEEAYAYLDLNDESMIDDLGLLYGVLISDKLKVGEAESLSRKALNLIKTSGKKEESLFITQLFRTFEKKIKSENAYSELEDLLDRSSSSKQILEYLLSNNSSKASKLTEEIMACSGISKATIQMYIRELEHYGVISVIGTGPKRVIRVNPNLDFMSDYLKRRANIEASSDVLQDTLETIDYLILDYCKRNKDLIVSRLVYKWAGEDYKKLKISDPKRKDCTTMFYYVNKRAGELSFLGYLSKSMECTHGMQRLTYSSTSKGEALLGTYKVNHTLEDFMGSISSHFLTSLDIKKLLKNYLGDNN